MRPAAELSMNDSDVVERFHTILGAGAVYVHHRPDKPHPVYRWQIQRFEHLQAFVAFVWPWLGQRRRARAREVLAAIQEQPRRRFCPHFEPPRYKNGSCRICSHNRYVESRVSAS